MWYSYIKIGVYEIYTNEEFRTSDEDFKKLVSEEKLNISSIEELMIDNIDNYKARLKTHIEVII